MSDFLYLEDIEPGDSWKSPARTVTESDIVSFAGMTGDFDPLHVDHQFASESAYGKPIAHGLLGMSMMAGLSSTCPRMRTVAFVRIGDWKFEKPIFVGDTVHVITEVESITPRGRRSGEVVWQRKLVNQRGESVQSGSLITIVSARSFLPRVKKVEAGQPASEKLEQLRKVAAEKIGHSQTASSTSADLRVDAAAANAVTSPTSAKGEQVNATEKAAVES